MTCAISAAEMPCVVGLLGLSGDSLAHAGANGFIRLKTPAHAKVMDKADHERDKRWAAHCALATD